MHDAAYTELAFDGYKPPSFLEAPGAMEVGIEFHSLSKTYNMTGWRLGMAVGNREVLGALGKIKSNIDSGAFDAIQMAGITALDSDQSCVGKTAPSSRNAGISWWGACRNGLRCGAPQGHLLRLAAGAPGHDLHGLHHPPPGKSLCIVTIPGNGLGAPGEGYVRLALTVPKERMEEALARLARLG